MSDPVRLVLGTLTRIPVPPPRHVDGAVARTAMLLAPLVGLLLGLLSAAVHAIAAALGAPGLLSAALALAALTWLTRGLHWDGLADVADALGSAAPPDRARAIMKDPTVGAFGVLSVAMVLLVQVSALAAPAARADAAALLVTSVVAARTVQTLACLRGVPGMVGQGLGSTVAGTVPAAAAVVIVLVVMLTASGYGLLADPGTWWVWPGVVAAGVLAGAATVAVCVRRLGGVSGDVLGAATEIAAAGALVVGSLLLAPR